MSEAAPVEPTRNGAAPIKAPVPAGIVILALAIGGFTIGTTEFSTMSLVPYFSVGLGITEATAAHVISAYALGVVVGAPVIAVLAARMDRRMLLVALMSIYGVANMVSAITPTYELMLVARFVAGLPHGAYFGVASLMAASLVPRNRRTTAVARIMVGLTIATVVGVPLSVVLGQSIGWRAGFILSAVLAFVTVAAIWAFAPRGTGRRSSVSPLRELAALGNRQVLLALLTGAVAFGGFFAIYTYIASTLLTITRVAPGMVPWYFLLFGVGMTIGTILAGWAADRAQTVTIFGIMAFGALLYGSFGLVAESPVMLAIFVTLVGMTGCLSTPVQSRLMDVAGEAQTMAAAMNHAAFNIANAAGPWAASIFIASGYPFTVAGWVGVVMALSGMVVFGLAVMDEKRRGLVLAE
ncbi:MAG: MFS transporter [Celeribacter sp.]|jgi:DHA1 family inner membrane transport protein